MKEMVNIIPLGACPKCGHSSFIVSEYQINEYLTNRDGEIVDSMDIEYDAVGICRNCYTEFKMYPTREGFIPLTRLREIMLNYSPHVEFIKIDIPNDIPNPMEVK
jgi:predicted nucleic-acid-binding Zn-ribbon protein